MRNPTPKLASSSIPPPRSLDLGSPSPLSRTTATPTAHLVRALGGFWEQAATEEARARGRRSGGVEVDCLVEEWFAVAGVAATVVGRGGEVGDTEEGADGVCDPGEAAEVGEEGDGAGVRGGRRRDQVWLVEGKQQCGSVSRSPIAPCGVEGRGGEGKAKRRSGEAGRRKEVGRRGGRSGGAREGGEWRGETEKGRRSVGGGGRTMEGGGTEREAERGMERGSGGARRRWIRSGEEREERSWTAIFGGGGGGAGRSSAAVDLELQGAGRSREELSGDGFGAARSGEEREEWEEWEERGGAWRRRLERGAGEARLWRERGGGESEEWGGADRLNSKRLDNYIRK